MFKSKAKTYCPVKIRVVGVGGCGGNAVTTMVNSGMEGVDFWAVNTDVHDLNLVPTTDKIQIGKELTKGRGTGGDPELGRKAAEESIEDLQILTEDVDMLFITAGMGGGTGTGAAPVIASLAKEKGILTVGVVTTPFYYESSRIKKAKRGLQELSPIVDTLLVVPNDKLMSMGNTPLSKALSEVSMDVLMKAVKSITGLLFKDAYWTLDFADVKTVMSKRGKALMGIGTGSGENKALEAAQSAINSPLLEDTDISNAKAALVNFTVDKEDFSVKDMKEAMEVIREALDVNDDENEIFIGVVFEENKREAEITLIATGIGEPEKDEIEKIDFKNIFSQKEFDGLGELNKLKENLNIEKKVVEDLDIPTFLRKQID
ncbi:MAG: cell division protein FtsZ [candidate division WOR-3 bacterium]